MEGLRDSGANPAKFAWSLGLWSSLFGLRPLI
jgi:hypothetical protein